eukprot:TRINITY_DN8062_c0_g1_i3.p1 TRINITY_DN8062_c0_g1~~TRINITY_DN8062_c0_g1_i3.p1  ORF type:complete len:161 (-),score=39.26 TRINITY_DN8062_c0_g1_i3:115-597(-)
MCIRDRCSIDLKRNLLVFQDVNLEVPFLPESQIQDRFSIKDMEEEAKKEEANASKAGNTAPKPPQSGGTVIGGGAPNPNRGPTQGQAVSGGTGAANLSGLLGAGAPRSTNFSEDAINQVMGLGCTREEAIQALTLANGNPEIAASILFSNFQQIRCKETP